MVGRKYEAGGIAKDGAKMVTAVSCAQVPKFTVIIGGIASAPAITACAAAPSRRASCGCGRMRASRVMGGEQAANVLAQVKRDGMEARGEDWPAEEEEAVQGADPRAVRDAGPSLLTPARGCGTMALIDPADTRMTLALGLSAALNAPIEPTRFGMFRM